MKGKYFIHASNPSFPFNHGGDRINGQKHSSKVFLMEFFKYGNKLKPAKGRLLISEPFLPDPNFERTVVLICEHNEEGSFGFVLNKPSIVKVNEVMEDIGGLDNIVFVGGPVQQDTLHYINRNVNITDAVEIVDNIYWGGDFETLITLCDTKQLTGKDIRFFLGYSGWGPGQLESELEQESWIVCDFVTNQLLFDTEPDQMWKRALDGMGGRFSVYSNYPVDPRLN